MRPPPRAISAASSGAASRSAAIAGAGSQSADSQRPTRRSSSGRSVSAKPSQTTARLRGSRCAHRDRAEPRADPFGAGETRPARRSQRHGASCAQPWLMTVRRRSIGQRKGAACSPRLRCRPVPLSPVERSAHSLPQWGRGFLRHWGRGCLRAELTPCRAPGCRSARMSSSCSMPIDRRT